MPVRCTDDATRAEAVRLYTSYMSGPEVAETLGISVHQVYSALRAAGVPRRPGHRPRAPVGAEYVNEDGYVTVKVPADWPYLHAMPGHGDGTWQRKHRKVMAEHLGRPLRKDEQVHHKNGDRQDNRIENLQLRIGNHGSGCAFRCQSCGSHDVVPAELG